MVWIGEGSPKRGHSSHQKKLNLIPLTTETGQNSDATGQNAGLSDLSDLKTREKPFA